MASAAGAIKAGRAYVEIFADTAALNKSLRVARGQLARFAMSVRAIGKAISTPFVSMQRTLASLATSLITLGTAFSTMGAIAALGLGRALGMFGEFDKQMRFVQGILGKTGEEMDSLRERAMDLGRTTSFTAVEVAQGMTELARAGRTTMQIYQEVAGALDLSRGTMTELGTATQILVSVMNQFGLSSDQSTRAADSLAAASNLAVHNFEELGQAMKFTGPIANVLGFTLEETAAALNMIANNGIRATLAGRQFARVLKEINQPSKRAQLEDMGVVLEQDGEFVNIIQLFEQLNKATQFMTKGERFGLFNELFGIGAQVATILTDNVDSLGGMTEEIITQRGAADDLARTVEGGLWGAFKRLQSAVSDAAIQLSDKLAPAISAAMNNVTEFVRQIGLSIKGSKDLAYSIAGGIAGFIAMGFAILGAGVALKVFAASMAVVGQLVITVFLPMIAGVKLLAALFSGALQAGLLVVRAGFLAVRASITLAAAGIEAFIILMGLMKTAAMVSFTAIQAAAVVMGGALSALSAVMFALPVVPFAAALLALYTVWEVVSTGIVIAVKAIWKIYTDAFDSMIQKGKDFKTAVVANTSAVGTAVSDLGKDIWNSLGNIDFSRGLKRFAGDFKEVISGIKATLISGDIQGAWEIAVAYMKMTWSRFLLYIKSTGIEEAFDNIKNSLIAFGSKAAVVFENIGAHIYNMASDLKFFTERVAQAVKYLYLVSKFRYDEASGVGAGFSDVNRDKKNVLGAAEIKGEFDEIEKAQSAQLERFNKEREQAWMKDIRDEQKARKEMYDAIERSQAEAQARQEKARLEADQKRMAQEEEAARLREERENKLRLATKAAQETGVGQTVGAFSSKLSSQILKASAMVNLEKLTEQGNDILSDIRTNTSNSGLTVGTA